MADSGKDEAEQPSSTAPAHGMQGRECPHCRSDRVQGWGSAHGLPRYRCNACKRTFNPLTGTSLARLRNKDKWFLFLRTLTQQRSVRKSAEICGIDNSTALRWRQRFAACTDAEKRSIMLALIESFPERMQGLQMSALEATPEWAGELLLTLMCWLG